MMQLPLLAPSSSQHPRADGAPGNTRVKGPGAGAQREAAFRNLMDGALASSGTSPARAGSLHQQTRQASSEEKSDDGGSTIPAGQDLVAAQGMPLPVPAVLAPSTVGLVPGTFEEDAAADPTVTQDAAAEAAAPGVSAAASTLPAAAAAATWGSATAQTGAGPVIIASAAGTPGPVPAPAGAAESGVADPATVVTPAPARTAAAQRDPEATPALAAGGAAAGAPGAATTSLPEAKHAAASAPEPATLSGPHLPADAAAVPSGQVASLPATPGSAAHAFPAQQAAAANAPAFTPPGRLTPQLAGPLFTLATAAPGEHVMTLRVSPENLGPLTVRAHIDGAGVRIELFAPGDAGRDALRTILPELRRGLAESGLGANLNLSQHSAPQDPAAGNQAAGQHGEAGQHREPGQQSQSPLRQVATPETVPPGVRPAVVVPGSLAGTLDVLA